MRDSPKESSNEINLDTKSRKRSHYHTDNSNYSPKRHRRTSPLSSYPMPPYSSHNYHHHYRRSKYDRKSSSSSTRSSDRSSPNENDGNSQHQKSTKGTLASELDKIRPKIKNKALTSNTSAKSDHSSKPDTDVSILKENMIN